MNRSLQMGKGWEDICILYKCSSKDAFGWGIQNQVDKMTCSVDSPFPQPFVALSNGTMNKIAMVGEMRVMPALNNRTSTHYC